jgi:predicted transposase YbfD/YdcC
MNALWVGVLTATPNLRQLESLTERFWVRISDSTLYGLLAKLRATPFRKLLVREVRNAWRAKELISELGLNVVAIDGKCVWTGHHKANRYCQFQQHQAGRDHYTMRVLRAQLVSSRCKVFIGQRPIGAKSSETSTFASFFRQLLADYGRTDMLDVISVDAGMNSKANADVIHGEGRAYLMALKNPQKELVEEAQRVLGRRRKPDAETPWERYRGTRIRRMLFRTTEMAGYHGWSHLQQVWRVRQETVHKDGRRTVEERYFMTSLSSGQTKGLRPLQLVRAHWAIENVGNWTMDTEWREDDCPWASRAIEVVGLLRLLAFNVIMRLRSRRLRSPDNRHRTWRNHIQLVTDVLILSARMTSDTLFAEDWSADALA